MSVVQISDDHRLQPVEYRTCFTSREHLEDAWKAGRSYLLAATLANRASIRQKVINAVHAKFSRIAMHGMAGGGPQDADDGPRDEDEDGLMEPPEVQQLAAELGIQNPGMPPGVALRGPPPPPIAQFGATVLCGLVAVAAPLVQAFSSAMDGMLSAVPVVDRIVLGDSAPPRKAPVETHDIRSLLLDADRQNALAAQHENGTGMDKRLSTSALWMGISLQLLLAAQSRSSDGTPLARKNKIKNKNKTKTKNKNKNKNLKRGLAHAVPSEPVVMDVFSSLLTSLQWNDFVREAGKDDGGGMVSALELEQLLMRSNGLEIGFKRKDLEGGDGDRLARGRAVIVLGGIGDRDGDHGDHDSVQGTLANVGVLNASKLLNAEVADDDALS